MAAVAADRFIVVQGKRWPCAAPVQQGEDIGLVFPALHLRVHPTRWIVLHWTGAENAPRDVHRNMLGHRSRKTGRPEPLSVHFVVDQHGGIVQLMDAQARAAHCAAHGGNAFGVGIEIISRGSDLTRSPRGFYRPLRTETIHGRQVTYADFLDAQVVAVTQLVQALCDAYALPLCAPLEPDGRVMSGALSVAELEQYRGPLGHYCLEPGKVDPGPELLRLIAAAGPGKVA